jgi:hypothetical protein
MRIEQHTANLLALNGRDRVLHGAGGTGHGDARLLERGNNIERDKKLILDHKNW